MLVGFAAETGDGLERARAKRERKGVDLIVLNDVARPDIGFEVDDNEVVLVGPDGAEHAREGAEGDRRRRHPRPRRAPPGRPGASRPASVPAVEKRAVIADLGGGVHRVTLPLPWALDHVHCYAVEDDDGWTIFDTGLGTPGTAARWRHAYADLGTPRIRRVIATHYHPDHNGNSAALMEITGAGRVRPGPP